MVEIVQGSVPHPGKPPSRSYQPLSRATCPLCGPYVVRRGGTDQAGSPICTTCDMTASEHAYRAEILADSAAVFAREWREFQSKRNQERT